MMVSNDRGDAVPTGKLWGKTKVPGSVQTFRVEYSFGKGRYPFATLEGEELNKLVKEARLKYERGPKQGEYIEEAFVNDLEDPFFQHTDLVWKIDEGEGTADPNNPIQAIIVDHLKTRGIVRQPHARMKRAGVRQQYELIDKDFDRRIQNEEVQKTLNLQKKYAALTVDKKRKLCTIIGMQVDQDTEAEDLDTILYNYIYDKDENKELFHSLCDLSTDKLNIKYYIALGRNQSLITRTTGGIFMFNGDVKLGYNEQEMEMFLSDKDNSDILESLMK